MNIDKKKLFRETEGRLHNYKFLEIQINNLELDIEKEDLVMAMESNFSVEYLHGVIHEEEGAPICLIDKISQKGESEEEKVVENLMLKEVLGKLEKRERQIIMLRYFEDRTQSEIGELLNISQVQVSRIEKKVLLKLKSYIS